MILSPFLEACDLYKRASYETLLICHQPLDWGLVYATKQSLSNIVEVYTLQEPIKMILFTVHMSLFQRLSWVYS